MNETTFGSLTKDEIRILIALQWERIVAAGPTGDEMAVEWLTDTIWACLRAYQR